MFVFATTWYVPAAGGIAPARARARGRVRARGRTAPHRLRTGRQKMAGMGEEKSTPVAPLAMEDKPRRKGEEIDVGHTGP